MRSDRGIAVIGCILLTACSDDTASPVPEDLQVAYSEVGVLASPDSSLTAVPWGVAADPQHGVIYVLDRPYRRVLVFDSSGMFLRQFGREGGAGDEFQNPSAITLNSEGTLTVLDSGLRRLSKWNHVGEPLGVRVLDHSYWGPGFVDRGDQLILPVSAASADPLEIRQELITTSNGEPEVIAALSQHQTVVELPCYRGLAPKLYAPDFVWTTKGDTTIVVRAPEYIVDFYVGNVLARSVAREIPPIPVTVEMAVDRLQSGQFSRMLQSCGIDPETAANALTYEEFTSPVQQIAVAPDGKLWVTRTPAPGLRSQVDVLSPEGNFLGFVAGMPAPIAFLSPGRFIGYVEDDLLGFQLVVGDLVPEARDIHP